MTSVRPTGTNGLRPGLSSTFGDDLRAARLERTRRSGVVGSETFPLLTPAQLLELPEPPWLVERLLPDSGLSVLYGAAATFKSFLALDWALSVAAGRSWFGRDVVRRPVIYIAAEGHAGLGVRYRAWTEAHPDSITAGRFQFVPQAVDLRDRRQVEEARRVLASLPERPGLIVIDTMARTMPGGDENAVKDVGEFLAAVDQLREGAAALVVHHAGKNGIQERGSSALRGAADLVAKVEREGRRPRLELSCEKLKDAAEWDPISLRFHPVAESGVLSLAVDEENRRDDVRDRVLEVVKAKGPLPKRDVRAAVKGRNAGIDNALRGLEADGLIEETAKGWKACPDPRGTLGHVPAGPFGGQCAPPGTPPSLKEGVLRGTPRARARCPVPERLGHTL